MEKKKLRKLPSRFIMQNEEKQSLRHRIVQARRAMTAAEWERIDAGILQQLVQDAAFQRSHVVFVFCSIAGEVSTKAILDYCWQSGKIVCIPRCGPNHTMEAHQILTHTDCVPGKFNIPEPAAHCPAIAPEALDLVLVPCLAADKQGNRIGYGGGYYDRYLQTCAGMTAALCPSQFVLQSVPTEPFDYPCQRIITEKGVLVPS